MSIDTLGKKPSNHGGKRPGAGRPPFSPTDEQRNLVKLMVGMGTSFERICMGILNPHTGKPISPQTFERAFKREIEVASMEMDAIANASLATQMKKGNMTALIWYQKNRQGWRDDPDAARNAKVDPAGTTMKHEVEVMGGLPDGSTAENPAGNSPAVPPEETHR